MTMTEVEIAEITAANLEVIAAFSSNYATHVGIYLSLAFGYCAAAYVAGKKLSRFQVILASIMFVAAAELQAVSMTTWVLAAREMLEATAQVNPAIEPQQNSRWVQVFGISLWQLGIIGSISFMWSVRKGGQP